MKRIVVQFGLIIIAVVSIIACSKQNEEELFGNKPGNGGVTCDTSNVSFTGSVVPILQNNCEGCHNAGFPSGGVNLVGFNNVQAAANSGRLLGAITHSSGFSPMPKDAAKLSSCDIEKIRIWINNGTLNN